MAKPNGAVLWRGPSRIDGAPIVAIAIGLKNASSNRKTGAMLQTYILREDLDPIHAARVGADVSICGNCPHRGHLERDNRKAHINTGELRNVGRTCYVNLGQGPLGVWRAYKRGAYAEHGRVYLRHLGAGRNVRLGTYGDPAAVPSWVWRELTTAATGRTGYTHQWRRFPELRALCMASADTEADATEAHAQGWRTFRVAMPGDLARLPIEAICPASAEAGKKLTCAQCLACNGATGRRGSIVIKAHGGFAVMANVIKRAPVRTAEV